MSRRRHLPLLVAATAWLIAGAAAARAEVSWAAGPPEEIVARAKATGSFLFIDFYAQWCGPCRWMDRHVFARPETARAMKDLPALRVDVETPAGEELATKLGVTTYPTMILLDGRGREAARLTTSLPLEDFIAWLEEARREARRAMAEGSGIGPPQARWTDDMARRATADQTVAAATRFFEGGETRRALEVLRTWVALHPNAGGAALNTIAWFLAERSLDLDVAEALARRAVEATARDTAALDTLAEVLYRKGEIDEARALAAECLRREPGDPYYRRQVQRFSRERDAAREGQ